MQMHARYDPAQDRIVLRLRGASPVEDATLWLTRRQWMAIAIACSRARAVAGDDRTDDRRSPTASIGARRNTSKEREAIAAEARLVAGVRFRRIPGGLRIELVPEAAAPLSMALKGGGLATFAALVERLARQAKWDLDAVLARAAEAAAAPKPVLH